MSEDGTELGTDTNDSVEGQSGREVRKASASRRRMGCLLTVFYLFTFLLVPNIILDFQLETEIDTGKRWVVLATVSILSVLSPIGIAWLRTAGPVRTWGFRDYARSIMTLAFLWALLLPAFIASGFAAQVDQKNLVLLSLNKIRNAQWEYMRAGITDENGDGQGDYGTFEQLENPRTAQAPFLDLGLSDGRRGAYRFEPTVRIGTESIAPGFLCTAVPASGKGRLELPAYYVDESTVIRHGAGPDARYDSPFFRLDGQPVSRWNRDEALAATQDESSDGAASL